MEVVQLIQVPKAKAKPLCPGVKRLRSGSQDLVPLTDAAPEEPLPSELKASCLADVESMEEQFGALKSLSMEAQAHISRRSWLPSCEAHG